MQKRNALTQITPNLLKTKQHFEVLDGLRGVAALAIVVFHFMEWIFSDFSKNFIGHGFLAVDFFFCLSGFVIAYAYDNRIGQLGVIEFFKARFIRLHPMVIMGSVLGLLAFIFDPFAGYLSEYSLGEIARIFLCSLLLIPYPVMEERAFNLFALNAPAWSLFWEYVANIFYAVLLYRIGRRYLFFLLVPAAAALLYISYRSGNLLGGWSGETFWDGGVRIAYSFLAGMLICRYGWIIKTKLSFISLSILLSLAFVMPYVKWSWLTEALVVLLYFPLIVSLGAGSSVAGVWRKICNFSGRISYPLYMTHYVAIWIFGNYLTKHEPGMNQLWVIVPVMTVLLVAFAYIVMRVYDTPVRDYLTRMRKSALKQKVSRQS